MIARADAQRDERPREGVDIVAEFRIGASIVHRRVFEGQLVGKFLDHFIQHLGKSLVDQAVLFPDELAVPALLLYKWSRRRAGRSNRLMMLTKCAKMIS